LLTSAKFLPGAAGFFPGDLELAAHFSEEILGSRFVLLCGLCGRECVSPAFSLGFELAFQVGHLLLGTFLFRASVEEPSLEFAFRGCT
jgi:hypothetical protein